MKKTLAILFSLLLADIIVVATGIFLWKEGNAVSLPYLLIPVVILVPFHWLAIAAYKDEQKKD